MSEEKHSEHKTHEHKKENHAHENKNHEHAVHKTHKKKIKKSQVWMIISGILAVLLVFSVYSNSTKNNTGIEELSSEEAGKKAIEFINQNVLAGQGEAELKTIEPQGALYKIKLSIQGQEFDSYMTKDGKILFPNAIDLEAVPENIPEEQPPVELPKKEKTEVELFVMSYCPYGMQAQNAMVPVIKALGDKADIKIKFVDYIMHGKEEIDENTIQYCIQKEQQDKYVTYLECFLESQDSENCKEKAGIDKTKLDSCITTADKEFNIEANYENKESWLSGRYPVYEVNAPEVEKYGVRGSPHLVINGQEYSGARTPEAYKQAICEGFLTAPEECSGVLSEESSGVEGSCS